MRMQKFMQGKAITPLILTSFLVIGWGSVEAQEDLEKPPAIPLTEEGQEPLPPKVQDEQLEPTVTIREAEDRLIEEYRISGRVYMIKITPKKGIPYYYVDTDGDGQLELDENQQALAPVQPVHWKILEWK